MKPWARAPGAQSLCEGARDSGRKLKELNTVARFTGCKFVITLTLGLSPQALR